MHSNLAEKKTTSRGWLTGDGVSGADVDATWDRWMRRYATSQINDSDDTAYYISMSQTSTSKTIIEGEPRVAMRQESQPDANNKACRILAVRHCTALYERSIETG